MHHRRLFVILPGLTLIALTACGEPEPIDLALSATASVDGQPAACGTAYTLGSTGASAELADARVFVSAVQLRGRDGSWVDLVLDQDTVWQHEGVALLDFEDGTAGCADSGNSDLNSSITGMVPDDTYDALRFHVGLPFELNHLDSATAPAPLNAQGMFWAWQGGYKSLRVDYVADARWNVHVGSTGCESAAPTVAPDAPCSRPNQPVITLEGFDPLSDTLDIDLGALVAGADLQSNQPDTPPGCMSMPMEPGDCSPVYTALGLDFSTGQCDGDCASQDVFGVSR